MRKISFQWRVTLMTALLIAAACILLNLLLFRSGSYYIESVGQYVVEFGDDSFPDDFSDDDIVTFELTPEQFDEFQSSFSQELKETKAGFWQRGWIVTAIVTILSSVIAHFFSGNSLKPLQRLYRYTGRNRIHSSTKERLPLTKETGIQRSTRDI